MELGCTQCTSRLEEVKDRLDMYKSMKQREGMSHRQRRALKFAKGR